MTELEYFWNVSPQNVAISETEVHVWRACLEPEEPKLRELSQTLSSDERTKADRFYFERDRNHFIAAHGFLRAILGRYSDMNPAHITFSYSPHGKPLLTWPLENICFNMSHSNGLALYAVTSNRHVGIDVEYVRPMPDAEELAKHFFSPREYALIRSLPRDRKEDIFFKAWTCKEAYLKATGEGLSGLEKVEVCLTPGESPWLLSIQGNSCITSGWSVHQLTPAPGYACALVSEGPVGRLRCFSERISRCSSH